MKWHIRARRVAVALLFAAFVGALTNHAPARQLNSQEFRGYTLSTARASNVERPLREALSSLAEPTEVALDAAANRILVRGSARAQQLTAQLIESLDRAPNRQPLGEPVLASYHVPADMLDAAAARLRGEFPPASGVSVAIDGRTSQLLVIAPPPLQDRVGDLVAAMAPRPPTDRSPAFSQPGEPAARERALMRLTHQSWSVIERAITQLWGTPLWTLDDGRGEMTRYRAESPTGEVVEFNVHRTRGEVEISGSTSMIAAATRLIRAVDRAPRAAGARTEVVSLTRARSEKVMRALGPVQFVERTADNQNSAIAEANRPGRGAAVIPAARGVPMLARLFQQRDAEEAGGENPPVDAPPGANQPMPGAAVSSVTGTVQIEYLEDLDAIIVSGNERDVERVLRIIEDIEQLSAETEPVIEVYPLLHVQSEALATTIAELYNEVLAPRQGRVSITALVKPNAVLLIGHAESVQAARRLIDQLDQPVDPASEFAVFRLRHASAADAQATVEQFYEERGGLGTRALVTADYRSNSLVVQAGPRDMVELRRLIEQIDTGDSAAVNEMRIFKLENTLAEDLAPVLQRAIVGQPGLRGVGQAGGGGQGQPFAAQAAGQAGVGQGTTSPKSLALQFLTIDGEGKRRLTSGILTDVRIEADPRANALLISAPAESIDLVEALVRELDQPPAAVAQVKVFTIVNGDASSLTELLRALFGQTAAGGGAGQQVQTFAVGDGEGGMVPLRFSVDARTNSIIAAGSAGDLNVVEAILLRLDESDIRQRQSTVYRLKNASALDVSNAINEYLRTERQSQQVTPGLLSPFEQIEREVVVVPEIVSNSLIVSATPRFYTEIARLVEQLDQRPPMVMIQVLIAEVSLNDTDEFGVELGLQDSVLFDRSLLDNIMNITNTTQTSTAEGIVTNTQQLVQTATLTPGFVFNNLPLGNSGSAQSQGTRERLGGQGLSHFSVGRVNSELGFGGLVLSASSENINILIRALQESRRLEILSRPQIMTLDNQPAFVQVGQRVPVISGTQINETGQVNTVNLEDVGLILGVTPRVSISEGLVAMEIDAEKSQVGPEAEGIPISISATGDVIRSPRIDRTLAQTTVSALSGQTVVLGGLITSSKSDIRRRVPLLSEIPILGNLFRFDSISNRRTELLIIMTPHIVRNEQEAEVIKQQESARIHWCLADVRRMHGDAGLRSRSDEWADSETIVIYPDLPPDALEPTLEPTPAGPPSPELIPLEPPHQAYPPGGPTPDQGTWHTPAPHPIQPVNHELRALPPSHPHEMNPGRNR